MTRLYLDEGLTLAQIGEKFGISRQAVHSRLVLAGVPRRGKGAASRLPSFEELKKSLNVEDILSRYLDHGMSVTKLEKVTGLSRSILKKIILGGGCEIRDQNFYTIRKYQTIYDLRLNESVVVELTDVASRAHARMHRVAKRAGTRLSVKRISEKQFKITRVG